VGTQGTALLLQQSCVKEEASAQIWHVLGIATVATSCSSGLCLPCAKVSTAAKQQIHDMSLA